MVEALSVAAVITFGGSLLLNLIALGAPYWFTSWIAHGGLWKFCIYTLCVKINSDWMKVTQSMMILAMLSVAVAILVAFLYMLKGNFICKACAKIMAGTAFASALFGVIAISLYGYKMADSTFGWAYWMALAHVLLSLVGAGMAVHLCKRNN